MNIPPVSPQLLFALIVLVYLLCFTYVPTNNGTHRPVYRNLADLTWYVFAARATRQDAHCPLRLRKKKMTRLVHAIHCTTHSAKPRNLNSEATNRRGYWDTLVQLIIFTWKDREHVAHPYVPTAYRRTSFYLFR